MAKWHRLPSKLIWYKLKWTRRQQEICPSHSLSERIILECKNLQLATKPWKECGPKVYLIWAMFHAQNKENLLNTTFNYKTIWNKKNQWNCQLYCFPAQRIYLTSLALYAITTFQNDTSDPINTNDWSWQTNINYWKTIRPSQNWKHKNPPSTLLYTINIDKNKNHTTGEHKVWIKPIILSIFIRMAQASIKQLTWDKLHRTRRQHEINQWLLQNWNCHPYASYKLPLGQKSQHGYRSSHTIFGPPRATKESKLTLDLNTEQNLMNSVISTHGLNTSERHRRPSRKLGRTRRQHVTTVQASIV